MAEKLVDAIVRLRQRGKEDQPPKLYVVTMLIFQIKRTILSEKWFNFVITHFASYCFRLFDSHFSSIYFSGLKYISAP